jgi:hypothetical protein
MEFLSARRFASEGIGHVTHLAGMAAAFIYLRLDWRPRAALDRFRRKLRARSRGLRVVEPARKASPAARAGRRSAGSGDDAEVDAILDKISREGIDSLTAAELKKLRERSARD